MAVHKGTRLAGVTAKLDEFGITFPLALDFDGEVFRRYRMPRLVFPINVVVGRDGKVVHFDTELPLDAAKQAIVAALEAP